MWNIVGCSPSGLSASLLSSRNFCGRNHKIFVSKRFKTGSVLSLGSGSFKTSYMHSYRWFSIIQFSRRRSACSHWKGCRNVLLQRRSHHIVESAKYPSYRCRLPHRVLNFYLQASSIMTALSIFHTPCHIRHGEVISKWCHNGLHNKFPRKEFLCGVNSVKPGYSGH